MDKKALNLHDAAWGLEFGTPGVVRLVPDDVGLSLLHQMAIAGSLDGVDVCLNSGVNPNQTAKNGMTAAKLAKGLGWKKVLSRLQAAGAQA